MYIPAEAIRALEQKYGLPRETALAYEMTPREFEMVRRSQKHGRAHDATLFIIQDNRIAVIKKPMYPPGAYRAPSGGIAPGEDFEAGAIREAYEETGLIIALERYLLRAYVKFTCGEGVINWTTHVFSARPVGGALQPVDTHEIVEARFATVEELCGSIRDALRTSGSTGLRYRSDLGDLVMEQLVEEGVIRKQG
ncbi:MAG TPA: NUDIX hydrolase [Blastocatellia bacterium]|nr:NUDIX hydrolase [Blastocatellia bacterium]